MKQQRAWLSSGFHWLANNIASRLTLIDKYTPDSILETFGAWDASGNGIVGGIHFVPTVNGIIIPIL